MSVHFSCGVYILIKDNEPIYVGSSIQLELRLKNHEITDYDFFVIIRTNTYKFVERYLVWFLQPKLNTQLKRFTPRKSLDKGDLQLV